MEEEIFSVTDLNFKAFVKPMSFSFDFEKKSLKENKVLISKFKREKDT